MNLVGVGNRGFLGTHRCSFQLFRTGEGMGGHLDQALG